MAEQEELELQEAPAPKSKKKLFIFGGIGLVVLLLVGAGLWFFLGGSDDTAVDAAEGEQVTEEAQANNSRKPSMWPCPDHFCSICRGQPFQAGGDKGTAHGAWQ